MFQVLNSPLWLVAVVLDSTGLPEDFKAVLYGWAGCALHKEIKSKEVPFT